MFITSRPEINELNQIRLQIYLSSATKIRKFEFYAQHHTRIE